MRTRVQTRVQGRVQTRGQSRSQSRSQSRGQTRAQRPPAGGPDEAAAGLGPDGRPQGRRQVAAAARALAVGIPLTLLAAAIGQEYDGVRLLSLLVPALAGAGLAGAVRAAVGWRGGPGRGRRSGREVVATAVGSARLAAAAALLSFRFAGLPFGPVGRWLPPLLVAVGTAVLVSAAPVRPRASADPP